MAERIQRSRKKGWRLPAGAIIVSRPTKWGNPYRVGDPVYDPITGRKRKTGLTAQEAVEKYRKWECPPSRSGLIVRELRGRDLVCWCPLLDKDGQPVPCHADILLAIANGGLTPNPVRSDGA